MDPVVFLIALFGVVGTAGYTIVKVARLITSRREQPSADMTERIEALERGLESLQQEQAETQERLDFAERLLAKPKDRAAT